MKPFLFDNIRVYSSQCKLRFPLKCEIMKMILNVSALAVWLQGKPKDDTSDCGICLNEEVTFV